MPKTKTNTKCSYCGRDEFYIYHRKKYSVEELKEMPQKELMKMAKTLGIHALEGKSMADDVFRLQKMGIDWAICLGCMKKAMNNVLGEGNDGGRVEHKSD